MDKTASENNNSFEKIALYVLFSVGVILLFFILTTFLSRNNAKLTMQNSHSDLINIKEIPTLSISEFVYNGIAQSLKSNGDINYNVLYKSTVKVSVNADDIQYEVDDTNKIITFFFPKFTIEKPIIDVGSISTIPNKGNLYMDEIISLCRDDALREAKKNQKLISSAKENIKSIIEAWYIPVLKGYSFEYKFGSEKGNEVK